MSVATKPVQQEEPLRTYSVRLRQSVGLRIERLSQAEMRSWSQQAAKLIEEALEAREETDPE